MNPMWTPEIGQLVRIDTAAMRSRGQHGVVLHPVWRSGRRRSLHDMDRWVVRWLREDGQRGRTESYHCRSITPVDDAVTKLGDLVRAR